MWYGVAEMTRLDAGSIRSCLVALTYYLFYSKMSSNSQTVFSTDAPTLTPLPTN